MFNKLSTILKIIFGHLPSIMWVTISLMSLYALACGAFWHIVTLLISVIFVVLNWPEAKEEYLKRRSKW